MTAERQTAEDDPHGLHEVGSLSYASLIALLQKDLGLEVSGLDFGVQTALVPTGTILGYSSTLTPPTGYLNTNGTTVSRNTYGSLFKAIGTTYGVGDGTTTFTLPTIANSIIKT